MNRSLCLGQYVKLKNGDVKMVVETIEEDENFTLFILDDLSCCSWLDIEEVINDEDVL